MPQKEIFMSQRLTTHAVILMAGKGIRIWPLSSTKPKPLIRIIDKTLLEYKLETLKDLVREVILVISPDKGSLASQDRTREIAGSCYRNLKIRYVIQEKPLGTGDAVKRALPLVKDRFLILNGDDIYREEDVRKCLKKFPSMLVQKTELPSRFGVIKPKKNWVEDIVEKPKRPPSSFIATGLYFLDKSVFEARIKKSTRGEYELPDYIRAYVKKEKLHFVVGRNWFPITYPWDILDVNEFFLKKGSLASQKRKKDIKGKIEKNCQIKDSVIIQKGTVVKSGTYIEGPVFIGRDCELGPNCYVRKFTTIGDNCRIGQGVEINNSIIGKNSRISHLSYVGDSIVGENCLVGGGTITANLRFDEKEIQTEIRGEKINTGKKKLGCVLGDNSKIGINVSFMPGTLVGANAVIWPNTLVRRNVPDKVIFHS